MESSTHPRRPLHERARETGFVLVWMAVMLSVLLGATALAIQWNHLSRDGSRMQKAADAAALAGVSYLPNQPLQAANIAYEIAESNGFVDGEDGVSVVATQAADDPSILQVTITRDVESIFGTILGDGFTTIQRVGRAQFSSPLPIGAPGLTFGNDPERWEEGSVGDIGSAYPDYWARIGGAYNKNQGEIKMNKTCVVVAEDMCQGLGGENADFDEGGWIYEIKIEDPGNFVIEVFDPAWVNDMVCGVFNNNAIGQFAVAADLDEDAIPGYPGTSTNPVPPAELDYVPAEPFERYTNRTLGDPGDPSADPPIPPTPNTAYDNPFCTKDSRVFGAGYRNPGDPYHQSPPMWTTYMVRGPGTTWNNATERSECDTDFPGIGQPRDADGVYPNAAAPLPIADLLQHPDQVEDFMEDTAIPGGLSNHPPLGAYYRTWYRLCTLHAPEAGTYYLQVQNRVKSDLTEVTYTDEVFSANHYAVRAFRLGVGGPEGDTTTSVSGWGMMEAMMSRPAADPGEPIRYHLLQLEPVDRERRLVVSIYDLGRHILGPWAGPMSYQIEPPPDSNYDTFDNCYATSNRTHGVMVQSRPLGDLIPAPDCLWSGRFMAQWLDVVVTIPADYDCGLGGVNPTDACWVFFSYISSTSEVSTTNGIAITATVDGDPVRLVR